MTAAVDRVTRRQNLAALSAAYDDWAAKNSAWTADTMAELEEGDEARERVAELEIRLLELNEEVVRLRDNARRDKATIDSLRAQRDTANVAPRTGW